MPTPADYRLSDAENAAIFERRIRPAEFGDQPPTAAPAAAAAQPSPNDSSLGLRRPVCLLLAGQTGAGKSHAAPPLAAALCSSSSSSASSAPPCCHLVADTHKVYHPAYAGLVADAAAGRCPPGLASAAAGPDARRWLARACSAAASQQRDTLVESASRFPDDVAAMAATFRAAGYRVCLVVLAVSAVQSRLGLLARFLDAQSAVASAAPPAAALVERPTMGPRLTPPPIHDESYAGLATLAERVDAAAAGPPAERLADAVLLVRRGNTVAFAQDYGPTTAQQQQQQQQHPPSSVAVALAAERRRTNLDVETAAFASDVARLRAAHPERTAELDALAAEHEALQTQTAAADNPPELRSLDPEALIAHLRSDWGEATATAL